MNINSENYVFIEYWFKIGILNLLTADHKATAILIQSLLPWCHKVYD